MQRAIRAIEYTAAAVILAAIIGFALYHMGGARDQCAGQFAAFREGC